MRGLKRDRRQGHRRWPCLRPEPPPGLLRSRDRRASFRPGCRRVHRIGPRDLILVRACRSSSPWLRPTQQCPSAGGVRADGGGVRTGS
jgi:hypothetical protein